MPAQASNVPLVRQLVSGLLDARCVEAALCADVKIAVTEACTNVVVHAYPGAVGPLETNMSLLPGHLLVSVRDRGLDFKPLPHDSGAPAFGFGLALISSLSDEFSMRSGNSGTEVQMMFALSDEPSGESPMDIGRAFAYTSQLSDDPPSPSDGIVLSMSAGAPLVGVLGRLVSLLAARADFSIDRLSDAQLLSDALATHMPHRAANGPVRIRVSEIEEGFDLLIGPLEPDGGRALVADTALPGVGSLLERLSDELAYEPATGSQAGAETLRVRMSREG
jgi:serine/threonine-protein kinase RsbW